MPTVTTSPRRTARRVLLTLACCLATSAAATPTAAHAGAVSTTPQQREAAAVAAVAKVGRPYLAGAAGPGRFDCSGLVDFSWRVAKRPLGVRSSYDMWRLGARVTRAGMQRGDLVFTWDRAYGHVGIYLGGNQYVHAPGSGRRVEIAPVPTGAGWVGAVRP